MNVALLAAAPTLKEVCSCTTFWALLVGGLGLWLLLPTRWKLGKTLGTLLVAIAGGLAAYDLPKLGTWVDQGVFWILATVTLGAAVATIASQSPIYSAIWLPFRFWVQQVCSCFREPNSSAGRPWSSTPARS